MSDSNELIRRAIAAYYRHLAGEADDTPNEQRSSVETIDGRQYVVLRAAEVIEVYRVTNRGQLKRLRRWPQQIKHGEQDGEVASSA